jgi:hypothetical protein
VLGSTIKIHFYYFFPKFLLFAINTLLSPGSSVGIATDYGLEGPRIEKKNPGGGEIFLHTPRPALGPTQSPVQWVAGISLG